MSPAVRDPVLTPFEVLTDYERRSLAHVAGAPELVEVPGVWRSIGFRCGTRHLASALDEIGEILALPAVATIPGTRRWLLGLANVRGSLVPIADLRDFLEGERTPVTESSRVMLVRQHGGTIGLLIDEVVGQRSFSEQQRTGAGSESDPRYMRFVSAVVPLGGEEWGVFSMARLVRAPEFMHAAA